MLKRLRQNMKPYFPLLAHKKLSKILLFITTNSMAIFINSSLNLLLTLKRIPHFLEYFNPSKATQLDDQQQLTFKQIQQTFPKLSSSHQQQLTDRTLHQSQFFKDKSEIHTQAYALLAVMYIY